MRLIVLCSAALAGLATGDLSRLEPARLVFAGVLALTGAGLAWRRPAWRMLALVGFAAALGGLRATLVPVPVLADAEAGLEPYLGQAVRLRGRVVQPPTIGPASARLQLDVEAVGAAGRDPREVTAPHVRVIGDPVSLGAVATGEMLVLQGRLVAGDSRAPPTLLFPRLLRRDRPPAFEPSGWIAGVRAAAQAGIQRNLSEPQASLAAGVLLGGTGHLDAGFRLRLQRSGLAHVVAIDGFKQVVVADMLSALAVRLLGPRVAAVPVGLGIVGYTLLTGAHPAAVRAGLMVGLAMLAGLSGRVADPLTSVVVAATCMAAVEPRVLLDVGLQLSLSATLGIVLLWPRLRARLRGVPRLVAEPVGLTLAVTLATLPVMLSVFQLVSLVSPLAHVLAVPLLPVVLVSTALLALVAPVQPLAAVIGWLVWVPSTLLVDDVEFFGSLPGAALSTGRLPPVAAGCLAAALLSWGIWGLPEADSMRRRWARARARISTSVARPGAFLAMCAAAGVLLQVVRPDGRLHVQHLAVGQGEAVFIRGPTGRTLLVVGGRLDGVQLASQVADCLAVWEHRLDSVLQLDPAAQAGLGPTLARYSAEQQLEATVDGRVDLGGGAVLDVYSSSEGQAAPAASIGFGRVWMPVIGQPPVPPTPDGSHNLQRAANSVSDGVDVWAASGAQDAQQSLVAEVR